MPHCVFMHRQDSIYDDSPAVQYQFPPQYLERAKRAIGNWIVYLEPSKVPETRGYFAVAKVQQIIADPGTPGMYLAVIEPGSYLDFATPVPFRSGGELVERGLLNAEGRLSGRAQAAIRPLSDRDFEVIVARGLDEAEALLPRTDPVPGVNGFEDEQAPYHPQPRERTNVLTSRALRDRIFRRVVLGAYAERCAFTGLKLINGGGRAEVNAAHIRPVEADGPDVIQNGIALSGTIHWMFDRGLLSLSDDLEILVSRHINDRERIRALLVPSGIAHAPMAARERPHPAFLRWHRETCYKH